PFYRRTPIMCHRALPGMCQPAEPGKQADQGVKDHQATLDLHGNPGNCEPTDTIPAHRLTAGRTLTGGTAAAGRGQARVLEIGLPTAPETRGGRHESRPSDAPPRR